MHGCVTRSLQIVLTVLLTCPAAAADPTKKSETAPDAAAIEFFESRVRPLLHRHCNECHSTKTGPENGELILDSSAGLKRGGSRGAVVVAGEPESSLLLEAVTYRDPDLQMPPDGRLSNADIATLEQWIRSGAAFPEYGEQAVRQAGGKIDIEAGRQFWAFQPLKQSDPPDVDHAATASNPIDRYVLQRLQQAATANSSQQTTSEPFLKPASQRTLARRLHFDLIGLPLAPAALDKFLAETSPDATERLVDRLLASPQFGERWARVWLDLARYTDTTASWLKGTGQAWLYRDWVARAMNEDVPFDRFVRLQLAADLMDDVAPTDYAALGYLGLSPTYWKELRLAPDVIRVVVAEEWDERIDAVSRTFLGLTVSCARCHDHKFDPVTMEDYYGLAGVFASTQLSDRPLLPEPKATVVRQARSKADSLEAKLKAIKDKESDEAKSLRAELAKIRSETPDYDAPWAHTVYDAAIYVQPNGEDATRLEYKAGEFRNVNVFRRGNPANKGDVVPRRFPAVLAAHNATPFQHGSGRLELADSLLNDARPLTARVIVNRIWAQYFGQGLVRTLSNFGTQGDRPTHPELLDALSLGLIEHDWSLKWLHRTIVLSATYQQSSEFDAEFNELDPENRLLWSIPRKRLPVEMWRDAMLAAADNLDQRIGGAPQAVDAAGNHRRTLYSLIARRELHRMLRLYDFPEPTAHSPKREPTTTPLQQLFVLNGPLVRTQSQTLARRLIERHESRNKRVEAAYLHLFGRPPTDAEQQLAAEFLQDAESVEGDPSSTWTRYVQVLFGLNEFLFVD
ncbi:MAG: PSD1 and planctomycete cytochrome C domain-containing protein [Planctomycetota bacterium]|jgi:hypothetical protein